MKLMITQFVLSIFNAARTEGELPSNAKDPSSQIYTECISDRGVGIGLATTVIRDRHLPGSAMTELCQYCDIRTSNVSRTNRPIKSGTELEFKWRESLELQESPPLLTFIDTICGYDVWVSFLMALRAVGFRESADLKFTTTRDIVKLGGQL